MSECLSFFRSVRYMGRHVLFRPDHCWWCVCRLGRFPTGTLRLSAGRWRSEKNRDTHSLTQLLTHALTQSLTQLLTHALTLIFFWRSRLCRGRYHVCRCVHGTDSMTAAIEKLNLKFFDLNSLSVFAFLVVCNVSGAEFTCMYNFLAPRSLYSFMLVVQYFTTAQLYRCLCLVIIK